jgi:hypothetical protein
MSRFFSIVICSVIATASVFAQSSFRYQYYQASHRGFFTSSTNWSNLSAFGNWDTGSIFNTADIRTQSFPGGNINTVFVIHPRTGPDNFTRIPMAQFSGRSNIVIYFSPTGWTSTSDFNSQSITNTGFANGYENESRSFSWTFGSDWSGVQIEVRSSSGEVLALGVVPSGGGTVSGTVTASTLDGAQVYADGLLIGPLQETVEQEVSGFSVGRGSFGFGFDSSYSHVQWKVQREDETSAFQGTVPVGGYTAQGGVTLKKDEVGEVFTLVDIGDGSPVWVSTGVSVSPNIQNFHSFVNNQYIELPEPMPTPPTLTDNTNQPQQPGDAPITTNTVTEPSNSEDMVTVDVEPVELPSSDDNETDVLANIGEMQELVQSIVFNLTVAQENFQVSAEQLQGMKLGGVGKNCIFSMGPAQIELQTSGVARAGLTLLILGMAVFACAGIIRGAIQ